MRRVGWGGQYMKPVPIRTEHFGFDGRGPELIRWLYYSDLLFEGTFWPDAPNGIHGAEYRIPPLSTGDPLPSTTVAVVDPTQCPRAWVVFHGLQVIQVVPEEVHSYWHSTVYEPGTRTGVWEVIGSEWLASFNPRHLANHKHFVLEFYDDLVEVVARELIFGHDEFSIDRVISKDSRFAYAYLRRAQIREKAQQWKEAMADYRSYASSASDQSSAAYALRCAEALATKLR
jgi:hypothetical protein